MLNSISGSPNVRADILNNVIGEFRDTIAAAGTPLGPPGTVPDLVRSHVANRARWLWLCEFPQMKAFQSKDRKDLNDAAVTALEKISTRALKVPPGDGSPADQTPSPSFGTRPTRTFPNPPDRNFSRGNQDG